MPRDQFSFTRHGMALVGWLRPRQALTALAVIVAVAAVPSSGLAHACRDYTLSQKDSGRSLALHVCDRVTIRLKEQFDGGYEWTVSRRPARSVLKLVSDRYVSPPKGVVGGTDTRVFVYRAVGKGGTSLKLTESRPFVHHSQIAKFTLCVSVS